MMEENGIPRGWVETTLGEVAKTNLYSINKSFAYKTILYLDTGSITKGKIDTLQHYDLKDAPSRAKRLVNKNDIVYSTVRPNLEHYGFISYPKENMVVSTGFTVITAEAINPKFLYYFLTQQNITEYLHSIAEQSVSTYPSIKAEDLETIEFVAPIFLPEQKTIASILTSFDDKIELLQAQNETLETIAQTIFKEWFGKYQVGDKLPEGWRVGKLEEVIEFINGYGFKSKELLNEPELNCLKVFKMGDIKKGGGFNPNKTRSYFKRDDAENLSKFILRNGDILMSMTDMKDAISLLGHTALMIYDDEYIVNQRVGLIRAENEIGIDYPFLYLLTNDEVFIANLRGRANSGVQVNLTTKSIKESPFVIPNKQTNTSFNKVVKPLFEKIKYNAQQIQTLQATRDTLLPKLMSGKVRVDEFKE